MYAEERQRAILKQARQHGRVDVATLAATFEITSETVRRDLTALERSGVLRRVHGGAIPVERLGFEPGLATRDTVMTAEKERIVAAALEQVPNEGAILLDAGTTVGRLAKIIPADRELTVVTHSLTTAFTLATRPNITLMLVGGRLRARTMAAVDSWALNALKDTYVDIAFIATNGISIERGLTTPDTAEAMIKRAAIAAARRTVLLADHTKIGNDHFARFADLSDIDTMITDTGVDPQLADEIAQTGIKVITV
ncbi:DeoR family transcriptional regulator, fructose operon transcriptional repressor [Amycolatopsis xylanica]|uniref:Lactose phosphotransferase system repressor n=1 Tax=Amycolatopsis xylanica TaxID=589385 RepID=A0A1H3GXK5_9PSEU|nr:DeoR/GlpR family DNA-binding transcription regulator [Amycolatopsis xylanica]SDY08046.1 DeoR family transcriptional regulator, fructose operon transcriptional repressor [Amycolatopsis xylanica]